MGHFDDKVKGPCLYCTGTGIDMDSPDCNCWHCQGLGEIYLHPNAYFPDRNDNQIAVDMVNLSMEDDPDKEYQGWGDNLEAYDYYHFPNNKLVIETYTNNTGSNKEHHYRVTGAYQGKWASYHRHTVFYADGEISHVNHDVEVTEEMPGQYAQYEAKNGTV